MIDVHDRPTIPSKKLKGQQGACPNPSTQQRSVRDQWRRRTAAPGALSASCRGIVSQIAALALAAEEKIAVRGATEKPLDSFDTPIKSLC